MTNAYHMVHYRRFESVPNNTSGKTLEGLCRKALGQLDMSNISLWQRAQDRLFDLGDVEGRQIVLNKVADLTSAVFGEMCLVQSRGLQAFLELQPSKVQLSNITLAEIFNLDEKFAPKGSQFIRGMIYWMSINDNLFFVKTQSMTGEFLHQYINWLLKSRTSVLGAAESFRLQAEFDKSQAAGDIGEIKSLRVSGKSAPQFTITPSDGGVKQKEVKTSRTIADRFVMFEQARPVVEAIFGKSKTDALVDSLGPEEYLAVDASVKVRGRRTEESREKFREIADDLAELTEGKVQIEGKDGRLSDGDAILRTRMPFSLPHDGSNLLDFDNVADQLQQVYSRFVQDGKIDS